MDDGTGAGRRFEFEDGKSRKYWQVSLEGPSFEVSFGRIGAPKGSTQAKTFGSPDEARRAVEKLVAEKLKKGYREVSAPAPARRPLSPGPRAAEKPAGRRASRGDASTIEPGPAPPLDTAGVGIEPEHVAWTLAEYEASRPHRGGPMPVDLPGIDERACLSSLRAWLRTLARPLQAGLAQSAAGEARVAQAILDLADGRRDDLDRRMAAGMLALGSPHAVDSEGNVTPAQLPPAALVFRLAWMKGGVGAAVEALAERDAIEARFVQPALVLVRPGSASGGIPWPSLGEDAVTLRRLLAGASDAEAEEAARAAREAWAGASLRTRVDLAVACPFAADLVEEAIEQVLDASGQHAPAPLSISSSAPNLAQVLGALPGVPGLAFAMPQAPSTSTAKAAMVQQLAAAMQQALAAAAIGLPSLHRATPADMAAELLGSARNAEDGVRLVTHVLQSDDSFGADLAEMARVAIARLGADATPVLELLLNARSLETPERLVQAVARVRTLKGRELLARHLDAKGSRDAVIAAFRETPGQAMSVLARRVATGADSSGAGASLLSQLVRADRERAERVASTLPAQAAALIRWQAQGSRVHEAPARDLPEILASPPWTRMGGRSSPIEVAGLVSRDVPDDGPAPVPSKLEPHDDPALVKRFRLGSLKGVRAWSLVHASDALLREIWSSPLLADMNWQWATDEVPSIMERLGVDGLPGMLRLGESHGGIIRAAALPFGSLQLIPHVRRWLLGGKVVKATAKEWIRRHPRHAAEGFVPPAVGPKGDHRVAGEAALRVLVSLGHEALVRQVARAHGEMALASVEEILGRDPLMAALPGRMPALPDFFDAGALPPPRLKDGRGALPRDAVRALGSMLSISTLAAPYPGIAEVKQACEPSSLADFAIELFHAWVRAGMPARQQWAFLSLAWLGDDRVAAMIPPLCERWSLESGHARALLGLDVLAALGTDATLAQLRKLGQGRGLRAMRAHAAKSLEAVAEARGLTAAELEDRLVPDLGLDPDGTLPLDFGPRQFRAGFGSRLEPVVRDAAGRMLKDLPAPGKADDQAKASEAAARWKALKKQAKSVVSDQVRRLELACVTGRAWDAESWRSLFLRHPLLQHVARRLAWAQVDDGGAVLAAFRVAEDGTLADVHDDAFALPTDARIALPHPLLLGAEGAAAWGRLLGDYGILQPFPQVGRPIHALTDDERGRKDLPRFAGVRAPTGKFLGLESRGWRRGPVEDGGMSGWMERNLAAGSVLVLSLKEGIVVGMPSEIPVQEIEQVAIVEKGEWRGEGTRTFADLSAVEACEVIADLEWLRS